MNISFETLVDEIAKFNKQGLDAPLEARHVLSLLNDPAIKRIVVDGYEYRGFIASGGSGLVFAVTDKTSRTGRALKLSRVNAIHSTTRRRDCQ